MSTSTVGTIMSRIRLATKESPIAVFKLGNQLSAKFAATAQTVHRINTGDPDLIGVYTRDSDLQTVREMLETV